MTSLYKYEKPDLFLIYTCHPTHPEITDSLGPSETTQKRST